MKSFSATGILLKRSNTGEADRVVTIFTREYGKITAIAKGCRKLTSSKLSVLEPGTFIKAYMVKTNSLPILTQASILEEYPTVRLDIVKIRKLFEVLEMIDALLVEEDVQEEVFALTLAMLERLDNASEQSGGFIRSSLRHVIEVLGFSEDGVVGANQSVKDYVEDVTSRKMKAFAYLNI